MSSDGLTQEMQGEPAVTFSRPTDGYGHRPRWTRREEQYHKLLEMAFRQWADDLSHRIVWDNERELAEAIASVLDIELRWGDDD